MAIKTISAAETAKREIAEVLLITKEVRAKSIEDDIAKVYHPGEEGRFRGTAKIQLLAMDAATRNLDYEIPDETKKTSKDSPKINLAKLSNADLDKEAQKIGIDVSDLKRAEKIAEIKKELNK